MPQLTETTWQRLLTDWASARRKLIVGGQHRPDPALAAALRALCADPSVVVIGDITSNLFPSVSDLSQWDVALGTRDPATLAALQPDLVVAFGGQVTSRSLKAFLRGAPPTHLWHVTPTLPAPDAFQALTLALPLRATEFFAELVGRTSAAPPISRQPDGSTYRMWWQDLHQRGRMAFRSFVEAQPFGEFQALDRVLAALPPGSHLQLGNSMPIRYANYLGVAPGHEPANIAGNRGTSGIDGAVSTAVGAALVHNGLTVLIVGDLGFFYDRNGLWHDHAPPNLRILVLNNHGGGIFDIIEGPNRLPADVRQRYFLTPQPLSARRTAEDHGLRYLHANDAATLAAQLVLFLAPSDRPVLLEIESDMAINSAVFRRFREMMAGLQAR